MRRLFVTALIVSTLSACGVSMGRPRATGASSASTKKECAACEKMCSVAGDAEENKSSVDACKADCKKSCE